MIQGGHNEPRRSKRDKEEAHQKVSRENGGTGARGRTYWPRPSVQARGHSASAVVTVEAEVPTGRNCEPKGDQARSEAGRRPGSAGAENGEGALVTSSSGDIHRTAGDEKKESLGLEGPLYGRHLTKLQRKALCEFIKEQRKTETLRSICNHLQIHVRSYYRWQQNGLRELSGGGGKNKITPREESQVVEVAKKNPEWHCRRIAYHLEKSAKVFIGKTKVAEIMKKHGLNHPFERKPARPQIVPSDMLLHEPWTKNLLWGMDWTWVNVNGKFMFLLVLLDWYSRKILSWGLYHKITQYQVVTVVTEAVAIEKIDLLPAGSLKPKVVADHGSANTAKYTKANIEIQGLTLWLSGIGRPTGNARTERVIGTLKREEISLQEQYASEVEAHTSIAKAIWDYNINRPHQGNGGFAPNSVHHHGRKSLMQRRARARQQTDALRRKHWEQGESPSSDSLT